MKRALGEEFGLVGRWVVGVIVFAVVGGLLERVLSATWALSAGTVAGLLAIDLLKKFRDDIVKCPYCRKRHDLDAIVCPYCRREFKITS